MKRVFVILHLLLSFSFFSQVDARDTNEGILKGSNITKGIYRNKSINPSPPEGTPYLNENFSFASVKQISEKEKLRYNIYKDEFEFITPKNDTLILDKIEEFGEITFKETNTKYKLLNYTDIYDKFTNGYLIDIFQKENVGLYKKENIYLSEEKIARTSMERNMPAKYHKSLTIYFLKLDNNIIEFPNSKKKLSKLLISKKESILNFVQEYNIDFDKEQDKIKIIDFLSTFKNN